ncbi:hypothetical protein M0R89_02185 [Halorussus limi]|uniref:Uncharacterized protein n=1 Tax=Halorussus limi TaxID=2938695 RepID=A0A8U0HW06_9EURY|nr:hypothetical protein [Halorussus limi]UPV74891.1 hypothetical protein M0R89_02185 [Halorussus limi]
MTTGALLPVSESGLVALQTATGGPETVVVLALAGLLTAAALSLVVVYKLFTGYRRNGTSPMLALAVGLALLVTGPIFLRLAFANLVAVSPATRSLATSASELLGLAAILYAIYDT